MAHRVFIVFLFLMSFTAVVAVAVHGLGYYLTPVHERHFRPEYETMKPSGSYSHGLGIIGASMITIGVATYSSRKRIKMLRDLGKISSWLEFHIFLCLLGPTLVVFHTTFKAGGVAAISLWTMLSVAASGVIGRFLYSYIPRNLKGNELTAQQITGELDRLASALSSTNVGEIVTKHISQKFEALPKPTTFLETVSTLFKLTRLRRTVKRMIRSMVAANVHSYETAQLLQRNAASFASLIQKSIVLNQVGKLFFYWHVVHLPFTVIMFITLALHITVTVILGYRWIF
jgi:hypothetical protein